MELSLSFLCVCVGLLLAVSGASAFADDVVLGTAPRNDAWTVIGMGGGGTMMIPRVSPHDEKLMLNACDMTGSYISYDGGDSWRMFNLRCGSSANAFDPSNENVIYVGNTGLFRSSDKGRTWELVYPDVAKNTYEYFRGDHGDHGYETDDPAYPVEHGDVRITAIAVDPGDSKTLYIAFGAGYQSSGNPRICVTRDGSKTFTMLTELGENDAVYDMMVPSGGAAPVAIHAAGVGTIFDGKWSIQSAPDGVEFRRGAIGRREKGLVFWATGNIQRTAAGMTGGIWTSGDLGKTWKDVGVNFCKLVGQAGSDSRSRRRGPSLQAVACPEAKGSVCYVGFAGVSMEGGVFQGIGKTTDSGATWTIVKAEGPHPATNAENSWQELRMHEGGSIWFDTPRNLCVAPNNPDIVLATDLFRTCRTTDGGKTWDTITSVDRGNDSWTTTGLDVTTCYGVHFDPFNTDNVFISYTDMALWRSEDAGKTWINSFDGIPREWRNTCYWVEFDPEVEGLLWAAWSGVHDIPRPKMWRGRGTDGYRGGITTSVDGGRTWTITNEGIDQGAVTQVLLEPESPVGKRTLYACVFGKGFYRSDDNGLTWQLKNAGIIPTDNFAWRVIRAKEGTLYHIVARRSERAEYGNEDDGALYVSDDRGESWSELPLPEGCNGPNGLLIDPKDSQRLYLGAWGKGDGWIPDTGGGIFLSEDAGKTWKCIFDEDQHIYDVTCDERNGRLYACGFESRAWYSDDSGATWKPIKGYNFHWGHRVVPDPLTPDKVYITTFGGSVWHGPATGDPKAVEDIVTEIPKKH